MRLEDIWKDIIDGESEIVGENINNIAHAVIENEKNKVDKVVGKDLSSNDYTDGEKEKLGGLPDSTELDKRFVLKVDKEEGKGLSSNDYTDSEKSKLGGLPNSTDLDNRMNLKADKEEMNNLLADKVNKEDGKGLSSNDFTNAEKEKLTGLQNYDDTNVYNEIKRVEENSKKIFSNALIGGKNGISTVMNDVSPIEHELNISLSSNIITDFSNVKVTRYGKNILTYPYINTTKESNGVKFTDNGNGTITVSGNATAYSDFRLYEGVPLVKNGYITFSAGRNYKNTAVTLALYDNSNTLIAQYQVSDAQSDFVEVVNLSDYPETVRWAITIKRRKDGEVSGTVFPQIEIGEIATEYEEYISPISVNAETIGQVNGIKSLFPTTSLITDNGDVTINCKYNRDINKAFAELQAIILEG
jgi:hypothetical protein